jgi:hypothetical protein
MARLVLSLVGFHLPCSQYAGCMLGMNTLAGRVNFVGGLPPGFIRSLSQQPSPAPGLCVVGRGNSFSPLASPLQTPAAATDLISFLKALLDCRMRRGIRFPQWWMLLVAILAILSNQGSLMGMERFVKRHRKTLNELLGTHIAKSPSDSTFRLLLAQLDVESFENLLHSWMGAQIGNDEQIDPLVCDGKTLRGSIDETASGAARFIAQVSLYSSRLGVAIAQSTYATDAGGEIAALRELLDRVDLEGALVQADALHANRPFPTTSNSRAPTS